jgi:putative membrane protein
MFNTKSYALGAAVFALAVMVAAFPARAADTKSGDKLSSGDANFVKEAASAGMMEVELGKMAQEKGSNDKVKQFGKQMQQDHGKANDELKQLASNKGVDLSSSLQKKHKSTVDKLAKLSGADFDRQYMRAMVDDHKEDVSKFDKESKNAKDPDVKQFASKTLPTLREHLKMAEETDKQVRTASSSSKAK